MIRVESVEMARIDLEQEGAFASAEVACGICGSVDGLVLYGIKLQSRDVVVVRCVTCDRKES